MRIFIFTLFTFLIAGTSTAQAGLIDTQICPTTVTVILKDYELLTLVEEKGKWGEEAYQREIHKSLTHENRSMALTFRISEYGPDDLVSGCSYSLNPQAGSHHIGFTAAATLYKDFLSGNLRFHSYVFFTRSDEDCASGGCGFSFSSNLTMTSDYRVLSHEFADSLYGPFGYAGSVQIR